MKRILLIAIIFIFTISFDVYAYDYKVVNVTTTFSEDIEFSDVKLIKLTFFDEGIDYVDDASTITNMVELSEENNYSQILHNVKIVDASHLFAIVDDDAYGTFDCNISLDTNTIDTANINILVSKNNLPKNEYSSIPTEILDKILGNSGTQTSESNNNKEENDDKNESKITESTTKKNDTIIHEELKKRQEQQEKENNKKKNDIITNVLFLILGIILFVTLLFVTYKFLIANK